MTKRKRPLLTATMRLLRAASDAPYVALTLSGTRVDILDQARQIVASGCRNSTTATLELSTGQGYSVCNRHGDATAVRTY